MTRQEQFEQEQALKNAKNIIEISVIFGIFMLLSISFVFGCITPEPNMYGTQIDEIHLHMRHIRMVHAYNLMYKSSHP